MIGVTKIGHAGQAFSYYSERDDYYLSDQSAAAWYGAGAADLGLAGDIDPTEFRDVLAGTFGDATAQNPDRHTPGWDVTFSAPKSVSIAALVGKDARLTTAHDEAVRAALDHLERHAVITRQRVGEGEYAYRNTGSLVAAVVRHSTSRDMDPQLHSHAVVANRTRDAATGKWVSIDSRQGLYSAQLEAGNVYMNALANGVRRAGYDIEWSVNDRGAASFDIQSISRETIEDFSRRKQTIDAALEAAGKPRDRASAAARQEQALRTRAEKEHLTASELHGRWEAQARAAGYEPGDRPATRDPSEKWDGVVAADASIRAAITHLSERETRFTGRQILAQARTFAQGRADERSLAAALHLAATNGALIASKTLQDVPGNRRELVDGYTTKAAEEVERGMLDSASRIAANGTGRERIGEVQRGTTTEAVVDAAIAQQEARTGHTFAGEQRAAVEGILGSESGLHIIQGLAGTAKTTTVLATVAEHARAGGWTVRAMAPTHAAADTLGDAIGAEAQTVAAVIHAAERPGVRPHELWIVDEAGMVSASDKHALLQRADEQSARVILVGDDQQIGSVGAGAAFAQLQAAHVDATYALSDIKRQSNAQLREAVYDALEGRVSEALGKVDVREHTRADEAAQAVADDYMRETGEGRDTLVVTLSRADRDAVNAAIQQRREAAGEVSDVVEVATLRDRQLTDTERSDASRYHVGDIVEATKDMPRGPARGEQAEIIRVADGRVTACRADGREWTFEPSKQGEVAVHEKATARIGSGDRIVAKGAIRTDGHEWLKNGTSLTVERVENGKIEAIDTAGSRHTIDVRQGAKLDLGYAQTANQAQGRTTDVVMAVMRSNQRKLADRSRLYVAMSRARQRAVIHTDNREKLVAQISGRTGQKEAALDPAKLARARRVDVQVSAVAEPKTTNGRGAKHGTVSEKTRAEHTPAKSIREFAASVRRDTAAAAARVGDWLDERQRQAPRRRFDKATKKMLRNVDKAAAARIAFARRGRGLLNPTRHAAVAQAKAQARRSKERIRGAQVVTHARWEAVDSGKRMEWHDPKATKLLVRSADGRTARSTDGGKTFIEAKGVRGMIDRRQAAAIAQRNEQLARHQQDHRLRGGGETMDSRELGRKALESHARDKEALLPPKRDWDAMAARHGVEYDRYGHRYAHDGKGGLHSEALTKRSHAMTATQHGRQTRAETDGHTAGAVRGMLARRAVEKTIKSEREGEIQRLERLAGDGAEPKTSKDGSGSRLEERPQTAPQRGAEPKTTKAETGKALAARRGGLRSGRDKGLKW